MQTGGVPQGAPLLLRSHVLHAADTSYSGIFSSSIRGNGFVTVDGIDGDLFVPRGLTAGAFQGDTVEIRLLTGPHGAHERRGGGGPYRPEAEVTRIVSRGITEIVGTVHRMGKHLFLAPDNAHIVRDFDIDNVSPGLSEGVKAAAEITEYGGPGRQPRVRITEILGRTGMPGVDVLSIARAYGLKEQFPEDAAAEAAKMPVRVHENVFAGAGRRDLRDEITVTIDGEDAKDLDDAVSLARRRDEASGEMLWHLGVHIADVSQYVRPRSPLDREAYRRGTSVYLADRVIPMLPAQLSNGICSLNQGEDRLALSCLMRIAASGEILDFEIAESVIRVDARLSYNGVMRFFEEGDDSEIRRALEETGARAPATALHRIAGSLRRMRKLASRLKARRAARGAVDFDMPESKLLLDRNGHCVGVVPAERNEATELIEDFMLAANTCAARFMKWMEIPGLYRVHAAPDEERLKKLGLLMKGLGLHAQGSIGRGQTHPGTIRQMLEKLQGLPEEGMLTRMALRCMARAEYSPLCAGHYGLALGDYCHFTSPIRRYPDLVVHRNIKAFLHGTMGEKRIRDEEAALPEIAARCSAAERRADEVERETVRCKKAEYMQDHLGEVYDAVISGVTGFALFAELPNTVEGMVPVHSLQDDLYSFDADRMRLTGERTGRTYALGGHIRVMCVMADPETRRVDLMPAEEEPAGRRRRTKRSDKT